MTSKYAEVTCKAELLIIIGDLPAKAALLNCNQFNGQYGCYMFVPKRTGKDLYIHIELQFMYHDNPMSNLLYTGKLWQGF